MSIDKATPALWQSVLLVSGCLLLVFALWEVSVKLFDIASWLLPAPSVIINTLFTNGQVLLAHAGQTLIEVLCGMLLAVTLGIGCAALIDSSTIARRLIYPLLVISQTIPAIVLAPLLVIWFGFGVLPKVIVVTLFCFFPIAINTAEGLGSSQKELLDLVRSMNASWWQTWSKIRLYSALPAFFSGLKIAASYSIIAAVIGEWVGAEQGLGIYLLRSAGAFQTAHVFATISVISLMSLAMFTLVVALERVMIPWNFRH